MFPLTVPITQTKNTRLFLTPSNSKISGPLEATGEVNFNNSVVTYFPRVFIDRGEGVYVKSHSHLTGAPGREGGGGPFDLENKNESTITLWQIYVNERT